MLSWPKYGRRGIVLKRTEIAYIVYSIKTGVSYMKINHPLSKHAFIEIVNTTKLKMWHLCVVLWICFRSDLHTILSILWYTSVIWFSIDYVDCLNFWKTLSNSNHLHKGESKLRYPDVHLQKWGDIAITILSIFIDIITCISHLIALGLL